MSISKEDQRHIMTLSELFALIRTRIETLQSVSSKGCPQREALEALAEIERRVAEMEDKSCTMDL